MTMARKTLAAFFVLAFFTLFPAIILKPITFVFASSAEGWIQTYGGNGNFYAESFVQASDGGFVIAGLTESDALLLKTNLYGNMEWNRTYAGAGSDAAKSLIRTSDGGYALVAGTQLVKFDAHGNMAWNRTLLGGNAANSLIQTSDDGYAIAGFSGEITSDEEVFWLAKTDKMGYTKWSEIYETVMNGRANSVIQTSDGGYALLGSSNFNPDFLLVKTDSLGEIEWSKKYEKPDEDFGRFIVQNNDGGYMLAGTLWNRSGTGHGGLIKTDSNGNMLWMKNYPSGFQLFMATTSDGGYVLCSNLTLIKTDSEGNTLWIKGLNPPPDLSYASELSVIQTQDGGYAVLGAGSFLTSDDSSAGITNVWIIKTDPEGNIPEFPSWAILPLLLVTIAATAAMRKHLSSKPLLKRGSHFRFTGRGLP
jgi:hypothetical protein